MLKVILLINRIIENAELMIPKEKEKPKASPTVQRLEEDIDLELQRERPSEEYVIAKVQNLATQLYQEISSKGLIAAQIARKRALLMNCQEEFNKDYFNDLIAYISLNEQGQVTLHTKTETELSEEE